MRNIEHIFAHDDDERRDRTYRFWFRMNGVGVNQEDRDRQIRYAIDEGMPVALIVHRYESAMGREGVEVHVYTCKMAYDRGGGYSLSLREMRRVIERTEELLAEWQPGPEGFQCEIDPACNEPGDRV